MLSLLLHPHTPLSSPLPQIPSPPLLVPSLPTHTSPTYAEALLGYRAAEIRLRASLPPLLLSPTVHRTDILEYELPPRKRLCLTAPAPRFEVGESSTAAAARHVGPALARDDLYRLLVSEARHAWEAWSHSMNCHKAFHAELQAYRGLINKHEIHILTRDTRIGSLETLAATLIAQTSSLQTQLTTALVRIDTLEAREPSHTDDLEDADNCA
ncbi:hypothetical protein Tco_0802301 [Tanacetum coccineum]|uniref:Uncharacterized protein n=1 Tax=Tanacetum coccineum TaxID=301880 RepID=A0ABQ5A2Q0_9ASTR